MSGVRLSRRYLPRMKAKGWGRIVFVSSESAIQIPVEMIYYGATKTAQLTLSRGLAESTAGTGVTVNSILPGPTASEGVETFVASSLLKRFATPEEVAVLVAFVVSPLASATNGAALRVDGGVIRSAV